MADNVVDMEIVDLPEAAGVTEDTLFPGYVPGLPNKAQKITAEQLKEYFGQEVFVATYGVTAPADVEAAYTAGKLVFCDYNGRIASTARPSTTHFIFAAIDGNESLYPMLNRSTGEWVNADTTIETRNFKTNVISSDSKDYQYPSAKAVYEFGKSLTIEGGGGEGLPGSDGEDGGYYIPNISQPDQYTMQVDFTASKDDMAQVPTINIDLPEGPRGPAGSDASVTIENIVTALGYTPADVETVNQLSNDKVDVNPQALSNPLQAQARENIGAASVDDIKWANLPDKPFDGDIVWDDTTVTGFSGSGLVAENHSFPTLTVGDVYYIVANGVTYKATVRFDDMTTYYFGGDESDSECPITISQDESDPEGYAAAYVASVEEGTYTFRVLKGEVKTIDEIYIPDTIARKTDVTWANLPDKPFGSEEQIVVLEETEMTFSSGADSVGISFPDIEEGEHYIIVVDGVEYPTLALYDDMVDEMVLGFDAQGEPFCPLEIRQGGEASFDPGVTYVYANAVAYGTHTISAFKVIKKPIDESVLPYTTEEWTFTLEDGSTVTKQVVLK